ncbi:MAG TPA: hypothetical protein IAB30_04810 [Candidatus Fimenecus excrementavium]|nr:hypothetical protein [Candidatus Fimenecus excrementavium]
MKKHAKKALRSVLAFAMAVVLLATSLPIAFAAGTYDPTPVFSKDATLWAWVTDNGDVQVIYPQATPNTEYISDKHIATYYITLYDLGPLTEVHNDPATETVPQAQIVVDASTATFASDGTGTVTFTAATLANKGVTLDDTHRFSVEVLAQDSTGWVSEPLTTIVSDVPQFVYDEELYKPLSENSTSVREMMLFEARNNDNNDQFSTDGLSGAKDYIQSGDTLKILGPIDQAGEENVSTGVDSRAYGFQISAAPSNGTTQSFSTAWSRQHWMGTDAEEVWYWLDLSQVELTGLSFDLKANGKRYGEFYWKNERMFGGYDTGRTFNNTPADDAYSLVTYSTRGTAADTYKGEAPYVYIQQDNGAWEKVMLNNGTIDLGHYKGYVRVPIEFMCSTKATYAEAHNDNFNMGSTAYDIDRAEENVKNFFDTQVLFKNGPVLVDEAGTPISDALLIQYRVFQIDVETGWNLSGGNESKYSLPYENDYPSVGANHYAHLEQPTWGASMLAAGYDQTDVDANLTVNSDSDPDNDKAYVDANGVVQNRENGYKAIDDIFGAGFSYTGVSSDSVRRDFFIDNVLFYKETGSYPSDMTEGETGAPVTNYYDQKVETPRIILSQIDQLITTPDLGDFRAVQYIDELIAGYRKAYSDAGMSTDFLSEENMATVAASLGMSGVWQRYLDARKACVDGGTIAYDKDSGTYTYLPNNEATDLVPKLIQSLEKLPDPSQVTSVSDTLRDEIVRLFQLYRRLNLTQLDAMSESEEQRILDYVALVRAAGGDEMLVGTSLATNKFLSFNDFESLPEGTHAYDLQDSPSWDQGKDYRYSKGFVYGSMSFRDFAAHSTAAVGDWMGDVSQDSYSNGLYDALNLAAADAVITDEVGAGGTKGAQVTIDSRFFSGDEGDPTGYVNAVSVTRDFNSTTGDYHDLQSIADWQLSRYAESWSASDGRDYPVGLVFYVDFSELKDIDFLLSLNIATSYDGHAEGYNLDMDMSGSEQAYKIMDMETGEWVTITGTGSPYGFTSKGGSSSIGTLADGYKGYVYVALNKFEYSTGMGTVDLCAMGEQIDNIRRVDIGIMPLNSTAAAQMDGRSFVVDDIGFAYGADTYDAAMSGSLNHPSFEEVKGYKSTAAQNFENAVSAIELNDDTNFPSRVQAARALYDALSDYQKNNTTSVKQAYAQLEFYEKIVNGELSADDYKPQMTVADFSNMVGSLSNELKNASVTGDHDLPYPGVKDTDGDGRADAVNYEGYKGLTKELAAQIIEYYNTSYSRYTENEKTALGITAQQFLNAYNAASRCYNTLEGLLADSNTFLNELYNPADASTSLFRTLSEIYYEPDAEEVFLGTAGDGKVYDYNKNTPYGTHTTVDGVKVNEGNYISITDTKALDHISKTYRSQMNYYAKHLLVAGQLQEGVKNIPNAVRKLVYNSYSTDRHGDPFTGGIWTLYNRYLTLYNNAKAKINAGKALTDEELADLKLATDEYEMLLPTYHNVAELYDLIQQIYDLFPAIKSTFTANGTTSSAQTHEMMLRYDGSTGPLESKEDPVYTLTQFEQYLTNPDGQGKLTITSENGGTLKSSDGTISLPYTLTYNGTAADLSTVTEVGNYAAPMTSGVALHVKIDNPQEYPVTLTDKVTLTFTYQYTDRLGILREVTDQKTLNIQYSTNDMYTVTIPAEVDIPWGTTAVSTAFEDASGNNGTGYKVTCNLNAGSSVSVQPTLATTSFALIHDGTNESIACTGTDTAAVQYEGQMINTQGAGPSISIPADEWKNIPVAAYRAEDQITYTVDYTDGSATP